MQVAVQVDGLAGPGRLKAVLLISGSADHLYLQQGPGAQPNFPVQRCPRSKLWDWLQPQHVAAQMAAQNLPSTAPQPTAEHLEFVSFLGAGDIR